MKTVIIILAFLLGGYSYSSAGEPILKFLDKRIVNIGDVEEGKMIERIFAIKNDGDTPLIIIKPVKSCNCTDVLFSKKVLNPGGEGRVTVKIDTHHKLGTNIITVVIVTNTSQQEHVIRVNMNVVKEG